ncbi:FAD/NAD(P)-binding domain containing protein [Rhypophila sp. PSN 637]
MAPATIETNGTNGTNGTTPEKFILKDTFIENHRPLRVVVVGAGFSGILAAIRIPERIPGIDLTVYEKNEGIGGVWWLNNYPGVACDIPSHSYQYSFEPNPNWSNLYAPGSEIRAYLQMVAEKYGATRFIKTSHKVGTCTWDESSKKWKVEVTKTATGETFTDEADVLVTARGQLNEPSWPDIPGLDKFEGKLMHSGQWDTSYDFRNKKIGIVGNGSSAIQIIPKLQKVEGAELKCFMRSPTWISFSFGDPAMMSLGLDPTITEITEEQRLKFTSDPESFFKHRKAFENDGNLIHDSTLKGTEMQAMGIQIFRSGMEKKLASRPDLLARLIPSFSPGCRRLTPGKGFLEALLEPNVTTIFDSITSVAPPTGVILSSSSSSSDPGSSSQTTLDIDVLICATGYQASTSPPFPVVGRGGQTLRSRWSPIPESYLSLAIDGFPNYLMMFGPNSAIGFGSLTKILEAETDYVCAIIRKLQKEDYATIEPKPERVKDFTAYIGAYFEKTVYTEKCKSWYRTEGGKGDWIAGIWPGSTLHALEALRSPRWEDWVYESADRESGNGLRWLGNGWSETQKTGDPSWYINPEEVEVPYPGKPEDNPRYKARPWSY